MADPTELTRGEFLTCRRILCMMIIMCFMVNYLIRVNMSIAIVEMIEANNSNTSATVNKQTFNWNEHQKNDILGCFYWGALLSAIPGGRLSEIYGTRTVLGTAMLLSSLLTIITPFACYMHFYCAIAVRFALGLTLGVSWPSIPPLAVRWVSLVDTSKFMSHTIACNLGAAFGLPICGYIIAYLGWPSVFYITGGVSLVWTCFWFYLVYDSPRQHPRISEKEEKVIKHEVGCQMDFSEKMKIPWIKILTSGAVWAIIIGDSGIQFNCNIILNELPSYMKEVLHFDIKQNGLLSGLPFFATYIMAILSSLVCDKWRKSGKLTSTALRKLFTAVAYFVPTVFYVLQIFWGNGRLMSVTVFTVSQGFLAVATAGVISNSMDISPAYSGTVFGLAFVGGSSTGYISSKLVAIITEKAANFEQWRFIFLILIGINVVGCTFYCIFASGEIQNWNPRPNNEVEMKNLTFDENKSEELNKNQQK